MLKIFMPRIQGGRSQYWPLLLGGRIGYLIFACDVTVVKGRVNICLNTRNNDKKVKNKVRKRTVKFDFMDLRF